MSNDKQYLSLMLNVYIQYYWIKLTSSLLSLFFMQKSYYYTKDYGFLIR